MSRLTLGLSAIAAFALVACSAGKEAPDTGKAKVETPPATTEQAETNDTRADFDAIVAKAKATSGPGEPAIWTLSDEDTTLHILGTVHVLKPQTKWRSDKLEAILDDMDTLVMEADVSSPEAQQEMGTLTLQLGLFTDGRNLSDILTKAQEAEIDKTLKTMDMSFATVKPMKPWFAGLMIANAAMVKEGYDPLSGVEMVLTEEASNEGAKLAYLETAEQQLRIFSGLAEDVQVDFLMATVESIEETPEMLDILVAEWADGDVAGLGVMMADPDAVGSDAVYDALLKDRNEDWVPKITAMLDEPGTRLIAVGAAHLAGEDSVITSLREEGYEVEGP